MILMAYFITYNLELQISHRVCTKVQKKSILWRKKVRNRSDIKRNVQVERGKLNNSRRMP